MFVLRPPIYWLQTLSFSLARSTNKNDGCWEGMTAFPWAHPARLTVQAREIFLPCREQWVVRLSSPALTEYLPRRDAAPGRSPHAVLSRQPSTPLPSGPAHLEFLLKHNLIRCASFSACALCPFFPAALGLERFSSWSDPCRVKASVERDVRKMQRGSAGSALLPERGILISLMHGQLAEGARSSPRVCALVIYRQYLMPSLDGN